MEILVRLNDASDTDGIYYVDLAGIDWQENAEGKLVKWRLGQAGNYTTAATGDYLEFGPVKKDGLPAVYRRVSFD